MGSVTAFSSDFLPLPRPRDFTQGVLPEAGRAGTWKRGCGRREVRPGPGVLCRAAGASGAALGRAGQELCLPAGEPKAEAITFSVRGGERQKRR